jgi:chorismate mutase
MNQNYFIVDKKILPENYDKVVKAKLLLNQHLAKDISDACKQIGISRTSYYKLKDYVFLSEDKSMERKAVLSFTLNHKLGILSDVLSLLAQKQANILTITQNYPIQNQAHVVLMMDIINLSLDIETLLEELSKMQGLNDIKLISIE